VGALHGSDGRLVTPDRATGVLVVTTLPGRTVRSARVVSTHDVDSRAETAVIVTSLNDLLRAVEAWWLVYWGARGPGDGT